MRQLLKKVIGLTNYRVIRATDSNRFQAIPEALTSLYKRGYRPRVIIDGGANVGEFTRIARRIFGSETEIHMFEPQPACARLLERLALEPKCHFHAQALGSGSGPTLVLELGSTESVTTGAHISPDASSPTGVTVPVVTLDQLLDTRLTGTDRTLLKLDLQGWELEALRGAEKTLAKIEVVLIEASFFAQAYEPSIAALVAYMESTGFLLYDIASLSARRRDNRPRQADLIFIHRLSELGSDTGWE